jgi:shikimate dehydrogenase
MSPAITGRTRITGIIGDPIAHSLSPLMHNAEFARLGLDFVYVAWRVEPQQLEDAIRGLRALEIAGFNITIPHKEAILPMLDEVQEQAGIIGAVNTVKNENGRLIGFNTDAPGWAEDAAQVISLAGKRVCVIGAGGAARAVCVGAAGKGASEVLIVNRTVERANRLADSLTPHFEKTRFSADAISPETAPRIAACQVLVNTTSVGMRSNPGMPIPEAAISEGQFVYDTIYGVGETELLRAAREHGCKIRDGLGMLVQQGAYAFQIWTGIMPDVQQMEAAILTKKDV